jgi:hypothetical protein
MVSLTNDPGDIGYLHSENKLNPCLSPHRLNPKWIKDLNIRSETLKLVQERAGNTVEAMAQARTSLVELSWHSN